MNRQRIQTVYGTLSFEFNSEATTCHSRQAAMQESTHVVLASGLPAFERKRLSRWGELGFGTTLNALRLRPNAKATQSETEHTAVEPFPMATDNELRFNGTDANGAIEVNDVFKRSRFATACPAHPSKREQYNVAYSDDFGLNTQPKLLTSEWFKAFNQRVKGCILVAYCAKGEVLCAVQSAGFEVERLFRPPVECEMFMAWKPL